MEEGSVEKIRLLKEIADYAKSIDESLKDLVVFFHSVEEMTLGDDDKYNEEIKKDGFHPPIG